MGPFVFDGPVGQPPWAAGEMRPAKRIRVAGAPGSCGPRSRPQPFPNPARPRVAGSSRQSRPGMQGDAELHHAIYMELLKDARGPSSVHALTGATWQSSNSRIIAPPPRAVIGLLAERLDDGESVADILDAVSAARVANSVRHSSMAAYSSHLRSVCAVCKLLDASIVPASLVTIRRYAAVCNNAVTLRGHLTAWRLLHLTLGHEWPGDRDPFLRAAHAGIVRLMPAARPKMAIRKDLTLKIVLHCFSTGDAKFVLFGIACALAYLFALRVPSELLRQGAIGKVQLHTDFSLYGPILRKGCSSASVLRRRCTCNGTYRPLCPHFWHKSLARICFPGATPFNVWTCQTFNDTLRRVLCSVGVAGPIAKHHCSHDFRRGCAKDMLVSDGPVAMMSHCGWKHRQTAYHYATKDEFDETIVANMLSEVSDEDV